MAVVVIEVVSEVDSVLLGEEVAVVVVEVVSEVDSVVL